VPEAGSGEPDICGGLENGRRGSRYPTLSAQNGERMGHPAAASSAISCQSFGTIHLLKHVDAQMRDLECRHQ